MIANNPIFFQIPCFLSLRNAASPHYNKICTFNYKIHFFQCRLFYEFCAIFYICVVFLIFSDIIADTDVPVRERCHNCEEYYGIIRTFEDEIDTMKNVMAHLNNQLAQSQNELAQSQNELTQSQNELAQSKNELAQS